MIGAMIVNIGGSISTTHFRPNAPITPRRSGLEYSTDAKAFVDEDTGAQEKNNSFCLSLQTSRFHETQQLVCVCVRFDCAICRVFAAL
ncbi:unnamed protein product [Durusdinium trenchii]|uniref:Uncharacterized protein n=1 Tax=Durusdinium trenchii TaxID=1381693 RepID=A0ABP0MQE8_9DINO